MRSASAPSTGSAEKRTSEYSRVDQSRRTARWIVL